MNPVDMPLRLEASLLWDQQRVIVIFHCQTSVNDWAVHVPER